MKFLNKFQNVHLLRSHLYGGVCWSYLASSYRKFCKRWENNKGAVCNVLRPTRLSACLNHFAFLKICEIIIYRKFHWCTSCRCRYSVRFVSMTNNYFKFEKNFICIAYLRYLIATKRSCAYIYGKKIITILEELCRLLIISILKNTFRTEQSSPEFRANFGLF